MKTVISNPPYSVPWEPTPTTFMEPRFIYGYPGKKGLIGCLY